MTRTLQRFRYNFHVVFTEMECSRCNGLGKSNTVISPFKRFSQRGKDVRNRPSTISRTGTTLRKKGSRTSHKSTASGIWAKCPSMKLTRRIHILTAPTKRNLRMPNDFIEIPEFQNKMFLNASSFNLNPILQRRCFFTAPTFSIHPLMPSSHYAFETAFHSTSNKRIFHDKAECITISKLIVQRDLLSEACRKV